ncbi:uncharacterized protein VICG_01967 [Vittaforma corneae ATCC 50505]|uniref:Superoxide dismutase n=1 Tax=Vittaforma corneae (strain ATCC 50505) TaxID=993615 RepID=L2GJF3_VITCO|nr:uncharacterized protein VICG_01967 [Vittaforma corneae ATCC 50505]ELA41008.1 hypothetical protein VICG_01967 [Vittaforma corneae ATCC 50505]
MKRFERPQLNYDYSDLEPSIDTETMRIHHTKHHQAYVDGLNKLSDAVPPKISLQNLLNGLMENEGIKPDDREILVKFGGGHYNHSLFWEYLSKGSNVSDISNFLFDRIKADFGSLEELQKRFDEASVKVFGSGWTWWVYDYSQNKSYIMTTKDQMNPIMLDKNLVCLLGLDVWEHAYYLKYQNRRAEYVQEFWNVVNWKAVSLIHDKVVLNKKTLEVTDNGYLKFE